MLTRKQESGFDAAVWNVRIDPTTVTVRVAVMLGLCALWFGLAFWIISEFVTG